MLDLVYIICLVALFFLAGINKISGFSGTVKGLGSKPFFSLFPLFIHRLIILGVIALEILAPILMILAVLYPVYSVYGYYSCVGLIAFTIAANIVYHNFLVDPSQRMAFLKNLSIIGGLGCALRMYS